jgi:phosphoserine phosphatase
MKAGRSTAVPSTTVHLWGPSSPKLQPACLNALASTGAPLLHLSQHSRHGFEHWTALFSGTLDSTSQNALGQFCLSHNVGLQITQGVGGRLGGCLCVTVLGDLGSGHALAAVAAAALQEGFLIRETRPVGGVTLRGVELIVSREDDSAVTEAQLEQLRGKVLEVSTLSQVDVAVQWDDFYRKNRRLLCMDVDSTFVKGEFIDELAAMVGVKAEVADITARAMRGELDFPGALRQRVKLLKGLPMSRAMELCESFELNPGADDLVRTAKRLGMRIGLVSGGFDFFVAQLKERYQLDFAFANTLGVENGVLTGEVIGTVVDAARKAQVLRDMAHVFKIDLRQTIAAGDGANDMQMLKTAGLGIAYQAKPKLREVADACFTHHDRLDTMLYLMGFDAIELSDACRA